ncbi:hypothetical protein [Capillimicrobium parvum]|uniref:Flagellar protein FlgJ N-terminal domain-containing protein n=1 Tax=Capillimicrobium parvum TaxID=2884022 RepID=A0A9E6XRT4_9ACTN|nr:hypothetical protein [Capillimicrobium parvum]UGS33692.1 hypothetical protein DSM104329_00057 [Capillimicrobium parvum]
MSPVPAIDQAALPADVRSAAPQTRARYQAALSFERQLTTVLAKQLSSTAGEALGSGAYAQLLPEALADAVTAAGGLGLARGLAGLGAPASGEEAA